MGLYIKELPVSELEFQMFVMDELGDELISQGKDVLKLTIGVSELPVPKPIKKIFSDTVHDHEKTCLVYPQGLPALREAIAEYYRTQFHVKTTAHNVVVNVGTSAIFRNLFQLLSKNGQEIMLPKPYYCLYLLSAILAGTKITYYDIDPVSKKVDFDSFQKAYDPVKTAIVVINNPGNPVGNIISKQDIVKMNDIIAGRSFVVHDDIYNNVLFYSKYESPLAYLDKYQKSHIITNGFSKGFRMYTKRVGYAILPESLVMPMRILQQHTLLTSDPVSQYGMIEALKDLESPKELTKIYRSRAEYTYEILKNTGCNPIKSDGGFYIMLDCEQWIKKKNMASSKALAVDILNQVYVSTVPGTDFGMPYGLRLSFCEIRYNEAIDRLQKYFVETAS